VRTLAIVLIAIAWVEAAWAAIVMAIGARGWPRRPAGRMTLLLLTSIAVLLGFSLWTVFVAPVPLLLRNIGMAGIVVALGWLIRLIYRRAIREQLRETVAEHERSTRVDRDTLWWRLVHLEPTLLRGAVTGIIGLAGALGILIAPGIPDAILGAWVPLVALAQMLWTRPSVTANARVVVEAPDPIASPRYVIPGDAVTRASDTAILNAAKDVPVG